MPRDKEILDLAARRRIYAYVTSHPGAYLREIQRALDAPMGSLEYHLDQLEKAGLVAIEQDANKRFFPARTSAEDVRLLSLLRREALRRIVSILLETGTCTHKELVARTSYPPSTVTFHVAKLVEAELVDRERDGRETRLTLRDPKQIHALLVRYQPTFLDRVLDAFLQGFDAMHLDPK